MKTIITATGTYRQITAPQARQLYAAGQPLHLCTYKATPANWTATNHIWYEPTEESDDGTIFDRLTAAYLAWLRDTKQGTRLHYYIDTVRMPYELSHERVHNLPLVYRKAIYLLMEHLYTREDIQLAFLSRACDLEDTISIEWI